MSGEVALRKAVREDIGKVWKMQTEAGVTPGLP